MLKIDVSGIQREVYKGAEFYLQPQIQSVGCGQGPFEPAIYRPGRSCLKYLPFVIVAGVAQGITASKMEAYPAEGADTLHIQVGVYIDWATGEQTEVHSSLREAGDRSTNSTVTSFFFNKNISVTKRL